MVLAYYTKSRLASAIMTRVAQVISCERVEHVLDVCAGSGRLTAAYRKAARSTNTPSSVTFIEPCLPALTIRFST